MARLDTDLLGLQIVARDKASLVGEIDGLILDERNLTVAGFLVGLGLYAANVLPFDQALAIGRDAVIVETAGSVGPISNSPRLDELARKEITISDATAITLSGKNVGTIGDFYVDTETGDIIGLEFFAADTGVYPSDKVVIPASTIHRLGRDIVVLQNDYDQHFLKDAESLDRIRRRGEEEAEPEVPAETVATEVSEPEPVVAEETLEEVESGEATEEGAAEIRPETAPEEPPGPIAEPVEHEETAAREIEAEPAPSEPVPEEAEFTEPAPGVEEFVSEAPPTPAEAPEAEEAEAFTGEAAAGEAPAEPAEPAGQPFDSEQKHFLVGKRVVRRLEMPSGGVLAEEGQIVDQNMIQEAKANDLLLILSLNVE